MSMNSIALISDKKSNVITAITENEVDYILELLHKDLGDKGFWSIVEEHALETMEEIKTYFEKNKD